MILLLALKCKDLISLIIFKLGYHRKIKLTNTIIW